MLPISLNRYGVAPVLQKKRSFEYSGAFALQSLPSQDVSDGVNSMLSLGLFRSLWLISAEMINAGRAFAKPFSKRQKLVTKLEITYNSVTFIFFR